MPQLFARDTGGPARAKRTLGEESPVDIAQGTLLGPRAVEVFPRHLISDDRFVSHLFISAYPREVSPGWLDSLVSRLSDGNVALHVEPVPSDIAASHLRRQLARYESTRRLEESRGKMPDPGLDVSLTDAQDLASRVACGTDRLFKVGLYISVPAASEEELAASVAHVKAAASSMMATAHCASFRQLDALASTTPGAADSLRERRTFDTSALAASFPFASAESTAKTGIFLGINAKSSGLVFFDRFAQDNYNSVTLAKSGAGKSYLAKLEVLRSLYSGVKVFVVDPEDEYRQLCDYVGGTRVAIGRADAGINALDLAPEPDPIVRRALFTRSLVPLLIGESLDASAQAALDLAVAAAYEKRGITTDPATHGRPSPTLADVAQALAIAGDAGNIHAAALAAKLGPYATGSSARFFSRPTSARPIADLVVFSLSALPEESKAAATLVVLDAIWRQVNAYPLSTPKLVTIDEGWQLVSHEAGARFLFRLAKSARKRFCGLAVFTQDASDLLASDLGRAVVANSATQILLSQSPQGLTAVAEAFALTEGERAYLKTASVGKGILMNPSEHVAFKAVASGEEDALIRTDPNRPDSGSLSRPIPHPLFDPHRRIRPTMRDRPDPPQGDISGCEKRPDAPYSTAASEAKDNPCPTS